jgi:serine/threonine protein kinase/Tfp pilus assembly protein PilF
VDLHNCACGYRFQPHQNGITRCPECRRLRWLGLQQVSAAAPEASAAADPEMSGAAGKTQLSDDHPTQAPLGALARGQLVAGLFDENFLLEDVKAGGMGVVLISRGEKSQKILAFKTYADDVPRNEKAFRQEAENWVRLGRYTHIVQALAVFDRDNRLYIALEYIPPHRERGTDLGEWIDSGQLDMPTALDIAVQICRGFEFAAKKFPSGFVHRDLKPSNVLIAPDGTAKLTDFGISRSLAPGILEKFGKLKVATVSGPAATRVYGTPLYMAPEQWTQGAELDARTDIYAFGCVLFEMLTKRAAFNLPEGESSPVAALALLHKEGAVPKLSSALAGAPQALETILSRCLAKDPENRFADFTQVRTALEDAMQAQGLTPPPEPAARTEQSSDAVNDAHNLLVLGKAAEALPLLEAAANQRPDDPNVFINRGAAKGMLGDIKGELADLGQAMILDAECEAAYHNRAQVHMKLGNFNEALEDFRRSHALRLHGGPARHGDHDRAAEHFLVGLGQLIEGDAGAAEEAFDDAIHMDPKLWVAFAFRSQARLAREDFPGAIADCDRATVLSPSSPQPLSMLANVHNAAQDYSAALDACESALELDAHYVMALNNRAAAYFGLENFDDCILDCTEAIRLEPDAPMPYLNRANAFLELGRGEDALPDYRQALALGLDAPWDEVAEAGIAHIEDAP